MAAANKQVREEHAWALGAHLSLYRAESRKGKAYTAEANGAGKARALTGPWLLGGRQP
jgi:hypothetical protein